MKVLRILRVLRETSFLLPKRIKLVRQVAECHADDGYDNVGNGRPPLEHFDKEFQAKIVDEDVADGHEEIPDNLRSTTQCGTRKTDVARHPKTRQESNRELEHEGRNVGRECDETEVKDLTFEDEMIENIVQHPLQHKIHSAACRVTEQLKAHHLAKRRIEKVDDGGQSAFNPKFYVFQG